jgi:chromate reductase
MNDLPILIIAGTNRPNSNAARIARVLVKHYTELNVPHDLLDLHDLPREMFDPGSYASKPTSVQQLQQRVVGALGLHLVVPEYNGSFPGVLKYFIDMLKFPESFERKPVAFVGEAAGLWGGLRSVEQLQHIFGYRNAHIYPDRVFIPGIGQKLDADGKLTDPSIDQRLAAPAKGFARFVRCLEASKA